MHHGPQNYIYLNKDFIEDIGLLSLGHLGECCAAQINVFLCRCLYYYYVHLARELLLLFDILDLAFFKIYLVLYFTDIKF